MFNLKGYKIFIASPSGLEEERKAFAHLIDEYNREEAIFRNVFFQAVGWEETLAGIGRPQSLINEELKQCDFFILLLHDRWGSFPGMNEKKATSGSEEEYHIAWQCYRDPGCPMKQVVCLFKSVPPNQLADPGNELQKVLEFKRKLEKEKELLYSTFLDVPEFSRKIKKYLSQWLRDDNNDSGEDKPVQPVDPVPANDLKALREQVLKDITANEHAAHSLIRQAWILVEEGRFTDAETEFSKALLNDPKEYQLLNYAHFLIKIGQIDKASLIINKAIDISCSGNTAGADAIKDVEKIVGAATIQAQEKERWEISIELHDNINQMLAGVILYMQVVQKEPEKNAELINQAINLLRTVIEEIRQLSRNLTPSLPENMGIDRAIRALVEEIQRVNVVDITYLPPEGDEKRIDANIELAVYRIVQEQLNNILKHAGATMVSVSLAFENNQLILAITDNGKGFNPETVTKGIGLKNISSRALIYDGTAEIISSPGNGATLKVSIPIPGDM